MLTVNRNDPVSACVGVLPPGDDPLPADGERVRAARGVRLPAHPVRRRHGEVPEPARPAARAEQRRRARAVQRLPRGQHSAADGEQRQARRPRVPHRGAVGGGQRRLGRGVPAADGRRVHTRSTMIVANDCCFANVVEVENCVFIINLFRLD